jgi:serine/threonine protein kinase
MNAKYRLKKRIGGGSFGEIYIAIDSMTGEEVAVKVESTKVRPPQLFNESRMYRALSGGVGIPTLKTYTVEADYSQLAMELLGSSLETLFDECERKFTLKTVLMIADQLIARIEYVHRRGIIHRDVKPDNFAIGRNPKSSVIYMIDFGLAKRYRDAHLMQHIPYVDGKSLIGTARYASINTHLGIEQSRRDDLESIAYMLIYFLRGSLPWMGLKGDTRHAKNSAICDAKVATPIGSLCKGLPNEFAAFLSDVRRLEFNEEPKYSSYREMFRQLFLRERYLHDMQFDWVNRQTVGQTAVLARPLSVLGCQNESAPSNLPAMGPPRKVIPVRPMRRISPIVTAPALKPGPRAYRH